ncbi:hypothetical protein FQR65_LT14375 [Abscondita terminalis]|nr:hypothetical protein FQR65_LT14375 [Abscondita terminalis]
MTYFQNTPDYQYIKNEGKPRKIIADNATYFNNARFIEHFTEQNIKIIFSSIRHSQGNPAERNIQEVIKYLRILITTNHKEWKDHLQKVENFINWTPNIITGYVPLYLMKGIDPPRPWENLEMRDYQQDLEKAKARVERKLRRYEEKMNMRIKKRTSFKENALVVIKNLREGRRNKGLCTKLMDPQIGPFRISRVINETTYELKYIDLIHPFVNDENVPSGIRRPRYASNRPLTAKEIQNEIDMIAAEGIKHVVENSVSSESEQDFSDDDSIIDKNYVSESSVNSSEDAVSNQSESKNEQQFVPADEQRLSSKKTEKPIITVKKSTKYVSDEHYGWSELEEDAVQFDFTGIPSININLPADAQPIQYFDKFFDNDIINIIVCETNRRANESIPKRPQLKRNLWKEVSNEEIRKFLGLCVLGGITKFPSPAKQWSRESIYYHPVFGKTMARDRFLGILKMLRFVNHSEVNTEDRLYKIRTILDAILKNIKSCLYPDKELSIDEAMILWRGRLVFRQYIPSKRHKYGIKLYELTTHDGYILNIIVYTGKGSLKTADVVKQFTKDYLGKGHVLYMDNFYNSVDLAETLFKEQTHVVGTLREDILENPKEMLKRKLKKGDAIWKRKGPVLVTKWKDKRDVRMISTKHKHIMTEIVGKRGGTKLKPDCVLDYNKHMSGIDRADQMLYYSTPRKTLRWYRKLFFHLLDICIVPCYKLYHTQGKQ